MITLESQRTEIIERIASTFIGRQFGSVTVRGAIGELTEDSFGNPLGVFNLRIDAPISGDTWPTKDMDELDRAIRDAVDASDLDIMCISRRTSVRRRSLKAQTVANGRATK